MSSSERYERRLPGLLEELAAPRMPDYFDDILGQVDRTPQRPGWTFIERWLPMSAVSERMATAPRVSIRVALVAALLVLALAVGLVLIVGSQNRHVPAPFGPAANGLIAFVDSDGAIRTGSLTTGKSTVVVPGAGHSRPVFAPDGTRLVYLQASPNGGDDIVISGFDGSAPTILTVDPYTSIGHLGWSPDGRTVVAAAPVNRLLAFDVAKAGAPNVITDKIYLEGRFAAFDTFNPGLADLFRPPVGDEILYLGSGAEGAGLYRQSLSGGEPIPVLTAKRTLVPFASLGAPTWSPDGTKIAFTLRPPGHPDFGLLYVVNADGAGLRRLTKLEVPGKDVDEEHAAWSPDGKKIAFGRWIMDARSNDVRPVTIVDVASGVETELPNLEVNGYNGWAWAPDGMSILEVPGTGSGDANRVLVVDPASGEVAEKDWTSGDAPSWQRTAP